MKKPTHSSVVRWDNRIQRQAQQMESCTHQALALALERLNRALQKGEPTAVRQAREGLAEIQQEIDAGLELRSRALEFVQPPRSVPPPALETPVYCISSSTLAEAMAFLTRRLPGTCSEPEWMLAVTGLKLGGMRTLERLIEVRLSSQSAAQAAFDVTDFTRIAVGLHEHGQALHAIFHSHRFKGAPRPSGTDTNLQRILEQGGYPAIQAVFSEDGYVRFFANRPFTVEIHGKGVVSIEQPAHLYRIVQFDTLPHPSADPRVQ